MEQKSIEKSNKVCSDTYSRRLKRLEKIISIYKSNGNWNANLYLFGVTNGLIIAQSIMTGQDEIPFLKKPSKFLDDD